jgi:hypothetical protein
MARVCLARGRVSRFPVCVRAGAHWKEPGGLRVILEHADGRTVGASGLEDGALCLAALKAVVE